jgi:hypothetical protein
MVSKYYFTGFPDIDWYRTGTCFLCPNGDPFSGVGAFCNEHLLMFVSKLNNISHYAANSPGNSYLRELEKRVFSWL